MIIPILMIFLFSFIITRYILFVCMKHARIDGVRYVLIACVISGVAAVLLFLTVPNTTQAIILIVLAAILASISVVDMSIGIIPNRLLLIGLITALVSLVYNIFGRGSAIEYNLLLNAIFGVLAGIVPPLAVLVFYRGGIGMGDIKLYMLLGLLLGTKYILIVFVLSMVIAGIYAAFMLLLKKMQRDSKIPMAPFIGAAAVLIICLQGWIS